MATNDRGIIYVASGSSFIEEACRSAISVKRNMPELPTTLFTHRLVEHPALDDVTVIDELANSDTAKLQKVMCMRRSPYRHTLFLDTDTHICSSVCELFELLEVFELGVAHAPNRLYFGDGSYPSDLPESFPEFNTGVMVYDGENEHVQSLFKNWERIYRDMRERKGVERDQIAFREVLYGSGVRFMTLTPEYNCRSQYPVYLEGEAKIVHARHGDYDLAEQVVNDKTHRRTFEPWMFQAPMWSRIRDFYRHFRQDVQVLLMPWLNT